MPVNCIEIETDKINGIWYELCCIILEIDNEKSVKYCSNYDTFGEVIPRDAVGITYDKVDGDWIKSYEIYTEGSKNCFIKYNQKGEIINQVCE